MANALPTTSEGKAQLFYVAYYGRPADPLGQAFWTGVIDAAGGDLASVSTDFGNSEEATAVYGGLSTAAAVNKLYNQMFNRDAEPAGLAYWVGEINSGNVRLSDLPLALYEGAQGTDAEAFANKLTVAQSFTDALDTTAEILAYNGMTAMAGATHLLATVDQDPDSVEAATAQIDGVIADIGAAPDQTLVLTTEIDDLVGGAGFDRFIGGTSTLTLGDAIDGGAGQDELQLTLAGTGGDAGDGLYAGFSVDNVETVTVRAVGTPTSSSDGVELSFTYVEGLETINVIRSTNVLTLSDIQNIVDVNLDDVANDVEIDFDAQAVMGSNDTLDLSIREVGDSAEGMVDLTIDEGIEILNIDDRGQDGFESDFALYGEGLEQIVITGGDDYTQTSERQGHLRLWEVDTDGNGATLDSTGFAGDLYVATTQYDVDQITTGVGDDEVVIWSDWDAGQTIDTGDGNDLVRVEGDYSSGYTLGGTIDTGNGNDVVVVGDYYGDGISETGLITTGDGNDSVTVWGTIAADGVDADLVAGTVLLGTGNDTLTVNAGDVNGLVDAGEGDDTLRIEDGQLGGTGVIRGGEGNDSLELSNDFFNGGQVVTAASTVTGIETLFLTNDDGDGEDVDHRIDLDAFDDALATIDIRNNSAFWADADQKVELTNLVDEAIRITSNNSDGSTTIPDGNNADVELSVALKDGSGEEDSLSVELYGGTAILPKPFEVIIADSSADSNIESLALENNGFGDREADTSQDFDVSLTVTGDSTDRLRVFNSTSQLVDATAYAGDFTIEVATVQGYEILTGSGNDIINLLADDFTEADTIDGGAGRDRIIVDKSTGLLGTESDEVFNNVSNVEELELLGDNDGDGFDVALDDDAFHAGIDTLIINPNGAVDADVRLVVGNDFDRDLRIDHNSGTLEIDKENGNLINEAFDINIFTDVEDGRGITLDAADSAKGAVNIEVKIDVDTDTLIANALDGASATTDGNLLLEVTNGAVASIVLVDKPGASGSTVIDNGAVEILVDDMWTNGAFDALTNPAIGTFTVDASAILDNDIDSTTGGVIFDGGDETNAKLVFTGSANDDEAYGGNQNDSFDLGAGDDYAEGGAGNDLMLGGAGSDTLWGDEGNDTIDGGDGVDYITGGLGADVLTGGAGVDTFFYDEALESNGLNLDIITDFVSGVDLISINDFVIAGTYNDGLGVDGLPGTADDVPVTGLVYLGEVEGYGAVLTALTAGSGDSQAVLDKLDGRLYIDLNNDGVLNDMDLVITLTGVTDLSQADFTVHA